MRGSLNGARDECFDDAIPPPSATATASSKSIAPAIGVSRIGCSILNRSIKRRFGHIALPRVNSDGTD